MMVNMKLEEAIQRVQKMEQYLDDILTAVHENPQSMRENKQLKEKLEILLDYYSNGLWLLDYERDERSEFPKDLKRGVLGQDTLYNLIIDLESGGEQ